ncbi:MAG TPA: type II secretion system major pseudopilin GspG [Verrucomicrobiae bacterium]|nr:type II secretion system major pseudopilin GspG [Verrucomicrobiae bacterium]
MKCNRFKPNRANTATRHGFTLIELLLVLTILGILAAIVVPRIVGRSEDARKQATTTQISAFKTALNTFEVDNGYFPKGQNGLLDLIQQPRDAQNWHGPYLDNDAVPKDAWGNDYAYTCPGKHNPGSYDVVSAGPDGQMGTDDDIGNWTARR